MGIKGLQAKDKSGFSTLVLRISDCLFSVNLLQYQNACEWIMFMSSLNLLIVVSRLHLCGLFLRHKWSVQNSKGHMHKPEEHISCSWLSSLIVLFCSPLLHHLPPVPYWFLKAFYIDSAFLLIQVMQFGFSWSRYWKGVRITKGILKSNTLKEKKGSR